MAIYASPASSSRLVWSVTATTPLNILNHLTLSSAFYELRRVLTALYWAGELRMARRLMVKYSAEDGVQENDVRSLATLALGEACAHQLEEAQWLAARFGVTADDSNLSATRAFFAACCGGHLSTMQWLVTHISGIGYCGALSVACSRGRLREAQWLADHFGLTKADTILDRDTALGLACEHGHIDVARWLVARFGITTDVAGSEGFTAFQLACRGCHLETAQWLAGRFAPTTADAARTLQAAGAEGRLDMIQWLVVRFGITLVAGVDGAYVKLAFDGACGRGHLSVAQWLAGHFSLTAAFAVAPGPRRESALGLACARGLQEVVQWMVTHFSLTPANVRFDFIEDPRGFDPGYTTNAFCVACRFGHLELARWLARWLAAQFDRSAASPRQGGAGCHASVLGWACSADDLETARWLLARFNVTASEASSALRGWHERSRAAAFRRFETETVQWLAARFGLTPAGAPAAGRASTAANWRARPS